MNTYDRHDQPRKRIAQLRKESACPASKVSTVALTDQEQSSASQQSKPTGVSLGSFFAAVFAGPSAKRDV